MNVLQIIKNDEESTYVNRCIAPSDHVYYASNNEIKEILINAFETEVKRQLGLVKNWKWNSHGAADSLAHTFRKSLRPFQDFHIDEVVERVKKDFDLEGEEYLPLIRLD